LKRDIQFATLRHITIVFSLLNQKTEEWKSRETRCIQYHFYWFIFSWLPFVGTQNILFLDCANRCL